jgi:hypothetical protein
LGAVARRNPDPSDIIQNDQIDIARIIQLVPPELSYSEHDEPAVALRFVWISQGEKPLASRLAQQVAQSCAQRRLSEATEGHGLPLERPSPGELRHGGKQCHAALSNPQTAHQRRDIFARIFGLLDTGGDFGEEWVRIFLDQAGQEGPFLDGDGAQKGAVAENRRE